MNNNLKQILPIYQDKNSQNQLSKSEFTDHTSEENCSNTSVSSDFSIDYSNKECDFDGNDGSTLNTLKNKGLYLVI